MSAWQAMGAMGVTMGVTALACLLLHAAASVASWRRRAPSIAPSCERGDAYQALDLARAALGIVHPDGVGTDQQTGEAYSYVSARHLEVTARAALEAEGIEVDELDATIDGLVMRTRWRWRWRSWLAPARRIDVPLGGADPLGAARALGMARKLYISGLLGLRIDDDPVADLARATDDAVAAAYEATAALLRSYCRRAKVPESQVIPQTLLLPVRGDGLPWSLSLLDRRSVAMLYAQLSEWAAPQGLATFDPGASPGGDELAEDFGAVGS